MLVTITILYGTLYPSDGLTKFNIWNYDKIGHFLMFVVWTFLFGIVRAVLKKKKPSLVMVFSLGLFYGLLIEALQFILPTNRSPELYDFIADALGSVVAILLLIPVFNRMFDED
ncbi:MAG: VanZ family protein [Balneolaceae bacterium]